ncbi:MAG: LysR family transcriptional regulator, partial [Cupriavidus sp.]|nr:LysR family transcriptional regulator [Cupriavidus sp.]
RLEETLEGMRRIGRNEKRWFGIGFVPSVLYGVLTELIRELRGDDSEVEVGLTEMITVQQLEALKSGRIDLAFGRLTFNDAAIVQQVVMAETLVAAMPVTAPPPTEPFDAAGLARQPLILYPARPRPSYADHVLSLFRAQGLQPRVVHEANELQTALGLVAAGLGITLVPSSVQRLHRDDVRYVPIDAPGFMSPVIMSYRAGDTSPHLARAIAWVTSRA